MIYKTLQGISVPDLYGLYDLYDLYKLYDWHDFYNLHDMHDLHDMNGSSSCCRVGPVYKYMNVS